MSIYTRVTRRPLMALILMAAASGAAPTRAQDLSEARRTQVARRLAESTVVVLAGSSSGSGFVAGRERWIVTNAHVVGRSNGPFQVRFSDGRTVPAHLLARAAHYDLA